MYELKNILPQMEIDLPTCMYQIKKCGIDFQENQEKSTPVSAFQFESSILKNLSNQIERICKSEKQKTLDAGLRQENLISRLKGLQQQLTDIRASLNMPEMPKTTFIGSQLKKEPLHDIVINAHPNFVPYALLALKNAWKNIFNIKVRVYSHSTISKISQEATEFQKNIEETTAAPNLPSIDITLIWKNCEHTEMISSPTMYVPIYGEVNIVRYLGRVGPEEYNYENSPLCNEIDAIMDICYQLLRCTTNKSRVALLRSLSNYLQQQKYFGGDVMSVADIAVCSTLRRIPQVSSKDLTNDLNQWHKTAKAVTLI